MFHFLLCRFLLCCIFFTLFTPCLSYSQSSLEEIQKTAIELKLHKHPQWLSLLHYTNTWFYNTKSLADDDKFFLAQNGKYDTKAELLKTLEAFFDLASVDENHPRCIFTARYKWLGEKLGFSNKEFIDKNCLRFKNWLAEINPDNLTLIFPTSFLNNPASAFGHTLLRINKKNQTKNSETLAYTVNFSANTNGEDPFSYAVKGTIGGYEGFFSLGPYYKQVNKYSDIESRDTWEFDLSFSYEEALFLVYHIWELRSIAFDYYYFDENCSFHLLPVLDVVRPELGLTKSVGSWVLPIDTVKLFKKKGLIRSSKFRPSVATRFKSRVEQSSRKVQAEALSLSNNLSFKYDLSEVERAKALELAYDYLSYKGRFSQKTDRNLNDKLLALLKLRSKHAFTDLFENPKVPNESPLKAHSASRLSTEFLLNSSELNYQLRFRPVYHSLIESKKGQTLGSQINFMDFTFRFGSEPKIRLEEFKFIDIISLNKTDQFISPFSWSLKANARQREFEVRDEKKESLVPEFSFTFGKSVAREKSWFYFMPQFKALGNNYYNVNFDGGLGLRVGLVHHFSEWLSLWFDADYSYLLKSERELMNVKPNIRFSLSEDINLRLSYEYERHLGLTDSEFVFSFDFYI